MFILDSVQDLIFLIKRYDLYHSFSFTIFRFYQFSKWKDNEYSSVSSKIFFLFFLFSFFFFLRFITIQLNIARTKLQREIVTLSTDGRAAQKC